VRGYEEKQITFVVLGTLPVCQLKKGHFELVPIQLHAKFQIFHDRSARVNKKRADFVSKFFRNPFGNLTSTVSTCPIIPPSSLWCGVGFGARVATLCTRNES
jgi:hypothetical protein